MASVYLLAHDYLVLRVLPEPFNDSYSLILIVPLKTTCLSSWSSLEAFSAAAKHSQHSSTASQVAARSGIDY